MNIMDIKYLNSLTGNFSSKIVKKTAEEFGLPYISQPTFLGALANHAKMLHKMRK